jgi:hypothetical protein
VSANLIWRDVLDSQGNDITPAEFAIDRQIEHRKIASSSFQLQLAPDRPNVLWAQRGFCSTQFSFVPR